MSDNLIFFQEAVSLKAAKYLKKRNEKQRIDLGALIVFYQALRRMLWQYRDIDQKSTLIGCEFVVSKDAKTKKATIEVRLIKNDKKYVVVKNDSLAYCCMEMFSSKLVKEGCVFFHWTHIEEFEEKLSNEKKQRSE